MCMQFVLSIECVNQYSIIAWADVLKDAVTGTKSL